MTNSRESLWMDQLERFGLHSLVKLILAVFALLFLMTLGSVLPGSDRLSSLLSIPFSAVVTTVVTLVTITLLYKIAIQARTLIGHVQSESPERRDCIAATVYWVVLLLATAIAYEGFRALSQPLFAYAGFPVLYPLFFVLVAIIPFSLLLVNVGMYLRLRQRSSTRATVLERDLQTDEERILNYLEKEGGTAYQSEFSSTTEWSKAKVSRRLSKMESDELIYRYQLGRKKVVCLPEHRPEIASPHE